MQKKNLQMSLIIGILLAILVFYIYQDLSGKNDDSNTPLIDQTNDLIEGVEVFENGDEDLIIEEITDGNIDIVDVQNIQKEVVPMPDLNRKIEFPIDFPEEAKQIMIDRINQVVQDIENNPNSYDDWISLGLQRKAIEDYKGVEIAWEYAKYLEPDKFLAWSNLGDLYAYYLRDNIKAEKNYIGAIERGSHQIFIYFKIAEFYTDFLNDKEKAIAIVKKGIEINPSSEDLQNLLNSLK